MSETSHSCTMNRWARVEIIIASGMAAGVFDAAYFSCRAIVRGQSPVKTLHGIAAFWLGGASFSGGAASATLGCATHFALATMMAAVYAAFAFRFPFIRRRPMVFGPVYGVLLYILMYYVVMAIRWPSLYPRFDGVDTMLAIAVHIVFGWIIASVVFALSRTPGETVE